MNEKSDEMQTRGHEFFLSVNGVWLTDHVPVEFIEFPCEASWGA
jgi:putative RNA 2'-phosphotransferase